MVSGKFFQSLNLARYIVIVWQMFISKMVTSLAALILTTIAANSGEQVTQIQSGQFLFQTGRRHTSCRPLAVEDGKILVMSLRVLPV